MHCCQVCILLQEILTHKLWLKLHGLWLKLHFVVDQTFADSHKDSVGQRPLSSLHVAAGDSCPQAVAEGSWAVAGIARRQPLCPQQGYAICLCGAQSVTDAEGRDTLPAGLAEHVQGWCHLRSCLCSCSCWDCLQSDHSVSIHSHLGSDVEDAFWRAVSTLLDSFRMPCYVDLTPDPIGGQGRLLCKSTLLLKMPTRTSD